MSDLSVKEERYDDIFLSILQQEGNIEPFLDSVFRFLHKRLYSTILIYFTIHY